MGIFPHSVSTRKESDLNKGFTPTLKDKCDPRKQGGFTPTLKDKCDPRKQGGFTFIEMIVVVAIIAILASILVGYSREAGKQLILSSNEAELVSLISRAKFLSIETFFEEASASTFRICAVGVHVDNAASEVFIFQDRVPVASDCSTATNIYEVSGDDLRMPGELDTVKLDDELVITGGGLNDVVFIPPDPDVIINNNPMQNSASINVSLIDGSGQFTVLITDAGQIRTPSP